jgi:hypothetical protein
MATQEREKGMNIQTIENEAKRGCGYRKEGGMYLMAGAPTASCGKLPLALDICPCCGQGIKPSRGWTWVSGAKLFEGRKCEADPSARPCNGGLCPLAYPPERMGLLWVGEKFYKTPADFLKEGMAQGVSRRLAAIPRDFVLGETLVLFAHAKAMTKPCPDCLVAPEPKVGDLICDCETCHGMSIIPQAGIFGCFRPERIEYIVKADDTTEKLEGIEKRGITLVKLTRTDGQEVHSDEE